MKHPKADSGDGGLPIDPLIDQGRRACLRHAAGVTAALAAPVVILDAVQATDSPRTAPGSAPGSAAVRWGLLIDAGKCADGCRACVDACDRENGLDRQMKPPAQSPADWDAQKAVWIRKITLRDNLTGRVTNLPMLCQHCERPPCVDVCPTGASFRRADGIVLVDRHTCIGCRYCMLACPYKARSFIHQVVHDQLTRVPRGKGCVESCDLCLSRRDHGLASTACAEACAAEGHHAILFGDLQDPAGPLGQALQTMASRQVRADLDLNTGVRYAGI